MRIEFDWDPTKAQSNRVKHGVGFEAAMSVFLDRLAMSRPDYDNEDREERWVTLGALGDGRLLAVVHTHIELDDDTVAVRIISARRATRNEMRQYEEGLEA
jgi:uncharacterized protein